MASPLLRLYDDVWTFIHNKLDLADLTRLATSGDRKLTSILARSVRHIVNLQDGPILDFNAILQACRNYSRIESLRVVPGKYLSLAKMPVLLDNLPPTLQSLDVPFSAIFDECAVFNFAATTPNLLKLAVRGSRSCKKSLKHFSLPPRLQVLSFIHASGNIALSVISTLPRTLLELTLHGTMPSKPRSGDTDFLFQWPPSLRSLTLGGHSGDMCIEHLPRNVTTLDLECLVDFKTEIQPISTNGLYFPWRLYFTYLTTLMLPDSMHIFDLGLLLRSIVSPEGLSTSQLEPFVSGGLNLTPTSATRKTASSELLFPSFTTLRLPIFLWHLDNLNDEMISLAPYLLSVDFLALSLRNGVDRLQHTRTTSLRLTSFTTTDGITFPSTLTALSAGNVPIAQLPATLRYLWCDSIVPSPPRVQSDYEGDTLPNLSTLLLTGGYSTSLASIMPKSLNCLEITIRRPDDWNTLASNLTSLRKLSIMLDTYWICSSVLTPIQSPHLNSFNIISKNRLAMDESKPCLAEFFSPTSSPLPPSITDLSHRGISIVHISILAVLPPNLKSLHLEGLTWGGLQHPTNKVLLPFSEGADLSPGALLQRLPRNLRSLTLLRHFQSAVSDVVSAKCLRFLPSKLSSFNSDHLFHIIEYSSKFHKELEAELPLSLARFDLSGSAVSLEFSKVNGTARS